MDGRCLTCRFWAARDAKTEPAEAICERQFEPNAGMRASHRNPDNHIPIVTNAMFGCTDYEEY